MILNPTQWALGPAGPQAGRIASLYWVFFWVSAVVYAVTITFLIVALVKSLRRVDPDSSAERERSLASGVTIGAVLTVLILFGLLFASVATGGAVGRFGDSNSPKPLEIQISGHQWWWEITYSDPEPDKMIRTANEIHIPIGRPVLLRLATRDVIHSFWVPNLHGKRDLIPGRVNKYWIQADRPGVYRGQCAEFCGLQHAHMALDVVAEKPEDFDRWEKHQQTPAQEPQTPEQVRGREVFLSAPCVNCHAITGTDAYATIGPDLTHLASRPTLGAGTLINNHGNLAGWIINPQAIKPGAQMPPNAIRSDQLQDLLAYLESLK